MHTVDELLKILENDPDAQNTFSLGYPINAYMVRKLLEDAKGSDDQIRESSYSVFIGLSRDVDLDISFIVERWANELESSNIKKRKNGAYFLGLYAMNNENISKSFEKLADLAINDSDSNTRYISTGALDDASKEPEKLNIVELKLLIKCVKNVFERNQYDEESKHDFLGVRKYVLSMIVKLFSRINILTNPLSNGLKKPVRIPRKIEKYRAGLRRALL